MNIQVGNVRLQKFRAEHTDRLFRLVNIPEVRNGMRTKAEILYVNHLNWVRKNLIESSHTHLFMLEGKEHEEAAVLIKNVNSESGELGIMVGNILSGRKSMFTSMLFTAILFYSFYKLNLKFLTMSIVPENISSQIVSKKIGAVLQNIDDTYLHFYLSKEMYESTPLNTMLNDRYQPMFTE